MEMSASEICTEIVGRMMKYPLYIINYSSSLNLTTLSQCMAYSSSPEVVAVSLSDKLVLELSSVYNPPRHFTTSSAAEVEENRFKSKIPNLSGRTITVATMHVPPHLIFQNLSKPVPASTLDSAATLPIVLLSLYTPHPSLMLALVTFILKDSLYYIDTLCHDKRTDSVKRKPVKIAYDTSYEIGADLRRGLRNDGIEVQTFKEMANSLNFTINYAMFESWGSVTANKTWDGGIGKALIDGEAEFGSGHIWQLAGLYKIIDFGPSYYKADIIFMVRKPEPIDFDWKKFLSIFQLAVWLATLTAFVFVIAACSAAYFLRHQYLNLGNCTLMVFGHFLMTSSDDLVGNGSSRHVLTGWSVFSLLLTSCLSSGIVSRLTLTLYSPRVDTIQQLVEQDYYWTAPRYHKYNRKQIKNWAFNVELGMRLSPRVTEALNTVLRTAFTSPN
ncbi:hypothetical protein J6590_015308 [Homalodisca vitripennis]|nr:hypothetical protein J6590_015308 [Homalodisca vitripennis]